MEEEEIRGGETGRPPSTAGSSRLNEILFSNLK